MSKQEKNISDREKAAQSAVEQLKSRFGEGAIMKLGEAKRMEVDVIPTGCLSLDLALGVGGIPRGRVIEIFGNEMTGKCVKDDTIVFSEYGMLPISRFGDVKMPEFQKKEVMVYSENCFERTSHFYNGGKKNTIKVKTSYGHELEGTPNHRIKVLDKNGDYLFRRLDELRPDDHVAIQRGQNCFGKGVDLSDFVYIKSIYNTNGKGFNNFKMTKELASLMGYMIGDGSCIRTGLNKNNIQITVADREVEQDFKRICRVIFGEEPKVTIKKGSKAKRLAIHNAKARAFLLHAGLGWWGASQKEIPYSIMCSPKDIVASFLQALFECDGCFSRKALEYCTKSKKLAKQVQIVLLNFGINSKVIARYNRKYQTSYYYLYIEGQKEKEIFAKDIRFISQRKQNKIEDNLKNRKIFRTNRDVVPNINKKLENLLENYRVKIRQTNRNDWKIFQDYLPQAKRYSAISYDRLKRILRRFADARNLPEYQYLENLFNLGFFWDKIIETEKSVAHVLDFTIPANATFFGNGFVNHNSTLALHIIAQAQKKGGVAAFVDAEHALDPEYAKKIGVKVDDLLISQPASGEQALEIVETLVRSNGVDVIVIDSVAALTPQKEIEGEMGDQHIGLQARLMSQGLRKLTSIVSKTKTSVIFINQIRMKIGVFFGNPETTTGGLALKFYSSVRIELRRLAQIKKGDQVMGNRVKAKIVKNKVAPPFKIAEFEIMYNEGISYTGDLLNLGAKHGLIKKKGNTLYYEQNKLGVGWENAKNFLKENSKIATDLKKQILKSIKEESR